MSNLIIKILKENKSFLLFISLMFVFRSSIADWNDVPTGSMNPTIVEGDRILVNKMAYDLRLPFTNIQLMKLSDPERGDIVIFNSDVANKRFVKRVIGIPGDTVELRDNALLINGQMLEYKTLTSDQVSLDKTEIIKGVEHLIRINKEGSSLSSFLPVKVPEGSYLVLGDNRDNSSDSRVIGLIPRDEIIGRTKSVILSLNYQNYFIPRADRFIHAL